MARRYATNASMHGWAMEECEEKLLIAGYEEIKRNIAPHLKWPDVFENGFYINGLGVLDTYLNHINNVRTRVGLTPLTFEETDVGSYARVDDRPMKSQKRLEWRNDWRALDAGGRNAWRDGALEQIARLGPPHVPFSDYVSTFGRKGHASDPVGLTPGERDRRQNAVASVRNATAPAVRARVPLPDLTLRMLRIAKTPDLLEKIVGKLSPEQAVEAAEKIEDDSVRNALLMHAVDLL